VPVVGAQLLPMPIERLQEVLAAIVPKVWVVIPVAANVDPPEAGTVALKFAVLDGPMLFDAVPLTVAVRVEFSCNVAPVKTPVAALNCPRVGVVPLSVELVLEVAVVERLVSACALVKLKAVEVLVWVKAA